MDEEAGPPLEWAGRGLAAVSGRHHPREGRKCQAVRRFKV